MRPTSAPEHYSTTLDTIVRLASCSPEMAWQHAGDIAIPRPLRLYEREQSTLNVFHECLRRELADPGDRLAPVAVVLEDIGKAHCVAFTGSNWAQGVHNSRIAENPLATEPTEVVSPDVRAVIELLVREESIGAALRSHGEEGVSWSAALAKATLGLDELRVRCPPSHRDRFDTYLLVRYLADAAAHTQRAQYPDAATGQRRRDVTDADRATDATLDGLFPKIPPIRRHY